MATNNTEQPIDITLCIGLFGVCVISIVGDDYDIVSGDIESNGTEEWFESLPKHSKPIEGIYTISAELIVTISNIAYNIVKSEAA
jgi:hypothetical protein